MKSIVIGTAGHIDHGKSALVMALTGTDPDRLKEEKARGITIDLGFAHAEIGGYDVAFVDVPGHERFVKNMLAGIGGIDAVLLVIAADESVMPQTREHFAICRLLGVSAGIIVLTKADLVDREVLELAKLDARELVAGSALERAPILPVSSRTGEGLDALREAIAQVAARTPERARDGAPRLPIDRVFSMRGFGTVVTGTLTAGTIEVDSDLVVLPAGRRVKVRGLQSHGVSQASVGAGRRVAVNLGGVDVADVQRGETLTRAGSLEPTRRFDAVVHLLSDARPLRHGARVRFHHGTVELLGRVALASPLVGDGAAIVELGPGRSAYARLRLEGMAVLTRDDQFILRSYSPSITIGGGRVIDPSPARTPIRTAAATLRFRRLNAGTSEAAMVFLDERGTTGLTIEQMARRIGLSIAATRRLAADLWAAKAAVLIGDLLFSELVVAGAATRLLAAVEQHHRTSPLSEGLPREEARTRVLGTGSPMLFAHVLASLVNQGRVVARDRLAIPGRTPTLSREESDAQVALEGVFRDAGLAPPEAAAAAAAAGITQPVADRVLRLLVRQGVLIKLDALLFHRDALAGIKEDVARLKGEGMAGGVDVTTFKARYGISRKYAIPLLEWLDRERVTRRVGNARVIL
ncbi:MAG TPA: selenocysteine-specific translation elongation factor [Vicinamibacterales bacterium]